MLLSDDVSDPTVASLLGIDRCGRLRRRGTRAPRSASPCSWPVHEGSSIATPQVDLIAAASSSADGCAAPAADAAGTARPIDSSRAIQRALGDHSAGGRRVVEGRHRTGLCSRCIGPSVGGRSGQCEHALHPVGRSDRAQQTSFRQRRSALAFDRTTSVTAASFFTMLARVMPQVDRHVCQLTDAVGTPCRGRRPFTLALFVHRVDGLSPALRAERATRRGRLAATSDVLAVRVEGATGLSERPAAVSPAGGRHAAIGCSAEPLASEIARDGASSLGMIAEFGSTLRRRGPCVLSQAVLGAGVDRAVALSRKRRRSEPADGYSAASSTTRSTR